MMNSIKKRKCGKRNLNSMRYFVVSNQSFIISPFVITMFETDICGNSDVTASKFY
jgi:hypothetical protein